MLGYWTGPFILLVNLAIAFEIWRSITPEQGPHSIAMGGFKAPLGIVFYVDKLALLFIIMVVLGTLIRENSRRNLAIIDCRRQLWARPFRRFI